ncbi:MAG: NAD(P)-binding protein [Coriobacteriia bacterium]|nr:NAD(P)-binding protein [Coriobacteriia bacterium]
MAKLTVLPTTDANTKNAAFMERYARRVGATPPGMCPVAVQLSLLQSAQMQTCGKCVPCRDGLPQLAKMLEQVLYCAADESALESIRVMATMVRDTSDCAIGWEAANAVLEGLDTFADEYKAHVTTHFCQESVGQSVPCETLCPAHVDVPGYIALAGEGDFAGAIRLIRKDNPFPTACALVCEHPCEERCRRALIDAPVNIRGIKKYAVDSLAADKVSVPSRLPDTGRRIAVIGGGPSGMTCAYFLALMGHAVTVFEGRKKLGGMMRYGIPAYRFPRERLDEDIRAILSVGNIDVRYETQVDAALMGEIAAEYDAVYVAIGAQGGKSLRLEGVDAEGVSSAVDLLSRIGDGDWTPDFTGKNVVVIGGGNVAMDCCRTSVRAGAESVTCVYRRRVEDMTALRMEIESAMQEGVEMLTLQSPVSIEVDESGHCAAVITQPQMISAVKRGRPAPKDADKPQQRIPADVVLLAVGQAIESAPFEEFGMKADRTYFCADEHLQAEGFQNVFVGGDCFTGPATVIRAIGAGKVAARNIDEYLGYHHTLDCGAKAPAAKPNDRTPYGRVEILERPANERKHDFAGVETSMSTEEAVQECGRCLRCDHYGCGITEGGRIQYA